MQLETVSESPLNIRPAKNRKIVVRYMDSKGGYTESRFHVGQEEDQKKFYKLLYWAAVNLVELRISPDV